MNSRTNTAMTRRRLLEAVGLGGALLPFIPVLSSQAETAGVPRRLVIFWTPNGIMRQQFTPGEPGALDLSQASILEPLTPFRDKLLFLEGVDFEAHMHHLGNSTGDHPPGHSMCMTAAAPGAGPSIDQFIASRLPDQTAFRSLVLGVYASGTTSDIFFREPGVQAIPENDPAAAFQLLFADDTDADALARLRAERRSVLDVVAGRLERLRSRVGAEDYEKIDAHLEAVREVEMQLGAGPCAPPEPGDGDDYLAQGNRQVDIAAAALRCDLTRVVTMQWSRAGSDRTFTDIGIPQGHHSLAHFNSDLDYDDMRERLYGIGRWYATRLARLCQQLDEVPEGDGTLLDHTTILWCSEHAAHNGGHDRVGMPYLIAGGGGGYFSTGRYVAYDGATNNDLYVSLCHAMGLEDVSAFGTPELSSGPLPDLT